MNKEGYQNKLKQLAFVIESKKIAAQDYLDNKINKNECINDLVQFRKEKINQQEIDRVNGLIDSGFFNGYSKNERIAYFLICFDIDKYRNELRWKKSCEIYSDEQPIFKLQPKILDYIRVKDNTKKDFELLDFSKLKQLNDSELIEINGIFTKIDSELNLNIVNWVKNEFKNNPIYIRIDPYKAFKSKPSIKLYEEIMKPANPKWWNNLSIYNNKKESSSYFLPENLELNEKSDKIDCLKYYDYNIKNIRKLEVIAKRNNNGNLSMMIEELTKIDEYNIMIGRMIHLDTIDKFGTDFHNSKLNHLDLAINIYIDDDANKRYNQDLSSGLKVQDATYRTHLLRVENIPFNSVLNFSVLFFKSKYLVCEWINDQFQKNIDIE